MLTGEGKFLPGGASRYHRQAGGMKRLALKKKTVLHAYDLHVVKNMRT